MPERFKSYLIELKLSDKPRKFTIFTFKSYLIELKPHMSGFFVSR